MKIIIPMASTDKDMLENYSVIKPLVKLGNKTMIETLIMIEIVIFVIVTLNQ